MDDFEKKEVLESFEKDGVTYQKVKYLNEKGKNIGENTFAYSEKLIEEDIERSKNRPVRVPMKEPDVNIMLAKVLLNQAVLINEIEKLKRG